MIRLIAAIDSKRGVATDSGIPWDLPGDKAYFRERTAEGLILMGRATYEEFAAPLHDRENFVLTRSSEPLREGFRAVSNLHELFTTHSGDDIWVVGGAAVYESAIPYSGELLLTQVDADFACTKFFPAHDRYSLAEHSVDCFENGVSYRFETWRPVTDPSVDQ